MIDQFLAGFRCAEQMRHMRQQPSVLLQLLQRQNVFQLFQVWRFQLAEVVFGVEHLLPGFYRLRHSVPRRRAPVTAARRVRFSRRPRRLAHFQPYLRREIAVDAVQRLGDVYKFLH